MRWGGYTAPPPFITYSRQTSDLKIELQTTLVLSVSISPIIHVSRRGLVEHIMGCCYVYITWHEKVVGYINLAKFTFFQVEKKINQAGEKLLSVD
jgi:hypothetical protein